jgi:hypothetical protein|tara:strand:+ start:500 stop:1114 length:615 start_codon:yes stop_codon:yes gene_type:complete
MSNHVKDYRDSLLPDIKFKGRKVCVITNYRTGSTFFIRETFLTNRIMPMGDWEHFNNNKDFNYLLHELQQRTAFSFKLMPDHIKLDKDKYHKILSQCDELVYLYRRDFEAQARGWIAWNKSGDHDHHYGELKRYDIKITQEEADKYTNQLINNYKFMNWSFKNYPGNVYCLEDFPLQVPYSRIYNWQSDITIPDFNTHKEVFRS